MSVGRYLGAALVTASAIIWPIGAPSAVAEPVMPYPPARRSGYPLIIAGYAIATLRVSKPLPSAHGRSDCASNTRRA